jgi:sucrose phosphorylase
LNRPQFHAQALQLQLQDPGQDASLNVAQLQYAMEQRANLPALDPDAPMRVISSGRSDVVILERGQENARLWAIHNFTATRQSLVLASLWGASSPRGWIDHLNPAGTVRTERQLELEPFGVYWISSR